MNEFTAGMVPHPWSGLGIGLPAVGLGKSMPCAWRPDIVGNGCAPQHLPTSGIVTRLVVAAPRCFTLT